MADPVTPIQSRPASGRRRGVTGRGLGLLALSVTVLIWGSTFVVSDVALTEMGPATLTFARFAVSLLVLLPFGIARGLTVGGMFRRRYALCGLTGVALYYGLQNLGLRFTTPDSAALLQAALPVLTVGLGVLWLGEAISPRRVVCLGLSVLGMLLVVGHGDAGAGRIGDAAVLGGVAAYAFYTAYVRRIVAGTDPLMLTCAANAWGLVFLAPWLLWEIATKGPGSMSLHAGLALAYLGVMASAVTLFLWTFALRKMPASVAGVFTGAIPAAGYAFSLFTGAPFAWSRLAGGALAVAGVTLPSIGHQVPARTHD